MGTFLKSFDMVFRFVRKDYRVLVRLFGFPRTQEWADGFPEVFCDDAMAFGGWVDTVREV